MNDNIENLKEYRLNKIVLQAGEAYAKHRESIKSLVLLRRENPDLFELSMKDMSCDLAAIIKEEMGEAEKWI